MRDAPLLLALLACAAMAVGLAAAAAEADHPQLDQWLAAQLSGGSAKSKTASYYREEDDRERLCFKETGRCGDWDPDIECEEVDADGAYKSDLQCCSSKRDYDGEAFNPATFLVGNCLVAYNARYRTAAAIDSPGLLAVGLAEVNCEVVGDCGHEGCEGLTLSSSTARAYLIGGAVAYGNYPPFENCRGLGDNCRTSGDSTASAGGDGRRRNGAVAGKKNSTDARTSRKRVQPRRAAPGEATVCAGAVVVLEGPFTVFRKDGKPSKYRDGWFQFASFASEDYDYDESPAPDYNHYTCEIPANDPSISGLPVFTPNEWTFMLNPGGY